MFIVTQTFFEDSIQLIKDTTSLYKESVNDITKWIQEGGDTALAIPLYARIGVDCGLLNEWTAIL